MESSGTFKPVIDPEKQPVTIVMPPPNITGQLHVGHALDEMPQDVLIRYHRMKGDPTLWVPGTDHASIATEIKVVEALKAEGISKEDIGREKFLERAWAWKKEYGGRIVRQLRKLGVSCDWSRERFTMDEGLSRAVRETFVRLYEKGLIYRGARIINWCPHLQNRPFRRGSGVCGAGFPPLAHPLSRRASATSSSPPPARKRCWAILACASTPPTSATRTW